MVEFGKTLNEVVKSDWRCHAVAYMELKRALSGENIKNVATNNKKPSRNAGDEDDHSVHTESSFKVTKEQKDDFFRIYDDSIRRVADFYADRVDWSDKEKNALEAAVTKCVNDSNKTICVFEEGENNDYQSSSSPSFLILRVTNYSKDLGLVLEFLDLNATAFSKILKKYDKRTGSMLRESKLKELKAHLPFLYGGGALKNHKSIATEWIKQLELLNLEKDAGEATAGSKGRKGTLEEVHLSVENSFLYDQEPKQGKPGLSGSVRFKEGTKEPNLPVVIHPKPCVKKKKDSQILLNILEKVNEELCLQKADSPFFRDSSSFRSPPSFTTSEIQMAKVLGAGEFCKIFEVRKFSVLESCHICFLHRGFNDPNPSPSKEGGSSAGSSRNSKPTHTKVPSSVIVNINDILRADKEAEELQQLCVPTHSDIPHVPQRRRTVEPEISIFGTFQADENISDYDELESDHEDDAYDQINTRGFMKDHCLRNGEARYAVKRIRHDLVGEEEITDAAVDLAREAQFLTGLSHPNIIKIRGTSNTPGHPKYCLILDRLYDTLEEQMVKWKVMVKRNRGKFRGIIGKKKDELNKIWMDRLLAAYDLSHALSYLHKRGIIHRDIKPENIGFDIRGDIKLFDFGLAKELKPKDKEGVDQYRTSGIAGTRRYMAPEVAFVSPYGYSADVYSFAIVLWEMLALKTAFECYCRERHYKEILVEGKRPELPKSWPFVIKNLLQRCWATKPADRPTFQSVCELIKFGLPEETIQSNHSTDSLMRRSIKSVYKDHSLQPSTTVGVTQRKVREADSLSTSLRIKGESAWDSLSTSIRIKSEFLQKNG